MDTTYCREPPFNIYYKISYLDKNYLFIGSYNDQLKNIFEKINSEKSLSKDDQDLLKKYYGNNFLENTKDHIYIPQFIDQDDTITTIKKKLLIYLDLNLDIEDLLIYSKRTSINLLEQESIKLRLLEDFNLIEYQKIKDIFNFVNFKSGLKNTDKLTKKNIDNIRINQITDILGFKYKNITGRKLIGFDIKNFKSEYEKAFDDDFIDEEHRTLDYYGELEETKLSYKNDKNDRKFKIFNLYLQTYGESTGIDEDTLSLYFPLKRTGESLRKSEFYKDMINDHDAIVNKYHSLSYEKNL